MNDLFGKRKCNVVIIKISDTHTQILKERKRDTYRKCLYIQKKKKTQKEAFKDDGWT